MSHKNGLEDYYVIRGQKKLRFGYTTGSCAAAACKGAVRMLLGGEKLESVSLMTPKGIPLCLELKDIKYGKDEVSCAVIKDAGDDPDTTDGLYIYASVRRTSGPGIILDGGEGVGRVTKAGLKQKIGEAAINPVPRAMILKEAEEAAGQYDYEGGLEIIISVPKGEETAKKTFNPRLGIVGGISILGTTGIVEPMSEKALIDSIQVEMKQHFCQGEKYLLVTPGNYGAEYLRQHMELPFERNIKCSNYIGETIDMAIDMGVEGILFVSHIGKFVKVAAGIMNTHSHSADGRMEVLCANAVRAGADLDCARKVLECNTTDEALEILESCRILQDTMRELMGRIQFYLNHRSYRQILLGAVVFSNTHGYLGQTEDAEKLIYKIQGQKIPEVLK
ncbi:MAG: cobalt-precorrin-5B (C(1))-methyltransferase CbiD [Eubacteriales bacterium]|nr:cobalt-precorrin-5B (C(1))-methyltransferase CbiD [Eubacteriales bacterium]